jgi:DNA mismatch repair ATPase MutS
MLRTELAFYLGCVNLHDRLAEINEPASFPVAAAAGKHILSAGGLYDLSLALSMGQQVVANDINANGKSRIIVTGANKGGKTTFLRSVGLSQLMMHSGMFVPARSFSANLCTGLFTHFKRKEDVSLESGKLDDELNRMSQIVDHLSAGSLVLLNESFAATNEREGAEIARQIVTALSEKLVKVIFVSHLYQFTHGLYKEKTDGILFLRAERKMDGTRTYRLSEGEPLDTSYGIDLYNIIFIADGKETDVKVQ